LTQAFHIPRHDIDLDIHCRADDVIVDDGGRLRVRNDRDVEARTIHLVDREARSVDGNRTLFGNVLGKPLGHLDAVDA
jgi:hypothetical protein